MRDADRPTLVACSAGVDSSALAIALAGVRPSPVVGHVVHDLRDRAASLADRDAAVRLAERLGLRFVEAESPIRAVGGNLEGAARRARYAALTEMATRNDCRHIATAHHADDQLETVLMRLLRGSGPRGLGGVMPVRRLGPGENALTIVRPMLMMGRETAVNICRWFGWEWTEDASNRDESFIRNAIRARVIPELKALRPDAAERAAVTAGVCRLAAEAIEERARLVLVRATLGVDDAGAGRTLDRAALAREPLAVRCEALRVLLRDAGGAGLDRAGWSTLRPAAVAIADTRADPREFRVGSILFRTRAQVVEVRRDQRPDEGCAENNERADDAIT